MLPSATIQSPTGTGSRDSVLGASEFCIYRRNVWCRVLHSVSTTGVFRLESLTAARRALFDVLLRTGTGTIRQSLLGSSELRRRSRVRLSEGSPAVAANARFAVGLAFALWSHALGNRRHLFDLPIAWLRTPLAFVYGVAIVVLLIAVKRRVLALGTGALAFVLVLIWWFSIKPSNDRPWQPDVAQTAWADIDGDLVTLYIVRNCDYRTATDYTPHWETRTVRLSQITGMDLAINYWGSPWIAHPIVSFQFADAPPLCFSIETRKEMGESYSTIGGIYRQFELIYIVADERDVLRVRTNYRRGEDVYLYRTTATLAQARERFHEYLRSLNEIRDHPRWYNAITTNCTTSIR